MSIRIVDYKKIDLTDDEWDMYNKICRSYDRPNFKGEELFRELFETDDDGIIVFLKPPSKNYTSMEVFLFVMSIQVHQHLRVMHRQVDEVLNSIKEEFKSLKDSLQVVDKRE